VTSIIETSDVPSRDRPEAALNAGVGGGGSATVVNAVTGPSLTAGWVRQPIGTM